MTAFNQDQQFAWLLIFLLVGGGCVLDIAKAQALTAEDRLSVLKFVGAFMNFLDLELENSTLATPESTSASTTSSVETTSITSSDNNSTETSTEASGTSSSTTTIVESSSSSSSTGSTDPGTSTSTSPTTEAATTTTVRRRMCFKRFCYKFSSDKGYIV